MNWPVALFRLWVLATAIWAGTVIWRHDIGCLRSHGWTGFNQAGCNGGQPSPWPEFLLPPIIVLIVGYGLLWVLKGLRAKL
jgi:hypothetical protein